MPEQNKRLCIFRGRRQSSGAHTPEVGCPAHQVLTNLTEQDDVDAYLHTFELVAAGEGWSWGGWTTMLASFLTGEVQQAYYSLTANVVSDYDTLKAKILA